MSTSGKLITAVLIVAVVVGGAVLLTNKKSDNKTGNSNTSQTGNDDRAPAASEVSIRYDGAKFILSADTVAVGGTVQVTNDSDKELDFASDPHPVHTDNSELNAGDIAAGETKSFTVGTKGKWGFHNHLNSSQRGELNVQ